jgi:hypothetical protein
LGPQVSPPPPCGKLEQRGSGMKRKQPRVESVGLPKVSPKAVEQLSSDKLETRLGGIYTLERIAGENLDGNDRAR